MKSCFIFQDVSCNLTKGKKYLWDGESARYIKANDRLGAINYALTEAIYKRLNQGLQIFHVEAKPRQYKVVENRSQYPEINLCYVSGKAPDRVFFYRSQGAADWSLHFENGEPIKVQISHLNEIGDTAASHDNFRPKLFGVQMAMYHNSSHGLRLPRPGKGDTPSPKPNQPSPFTPATITTADHVKSVIEAQSKPKTESGGGSVDYYKVPVANPTTAPEPYVMEANDLFESLDLTYAESNIIKEIWRTAAERKLGVRKAGNSKQRAAEKVIFFAHRYGVQNGKISKDN